MLFSRLLKGRKSTIWVTLSAGLAFVAGAVYMYRVPVNTVTDQLLQILLLFACLMILALVCVAMFVGIRKLFTKR